MMVIDNKYDIGQTVYLATDVDQQARMVTGIKINGGRAILYYLSLGTVETEHYDIEITEEVNVLAKT